MSILLVLAELLVLTTILVALMLLVFALADLVQHPIESWNAGGQSPMMWALVVVLLGVVGPLLYLRIARPRLRAARGDADDTLELKRPVLGIGL